MSEQPQDPMRIVISSEDLSSAAIDHRVEEMARARQVALVRDVGTPTKAASPWRAILTLTLGGLVGGILAFVLQRVLLSNMELFADDADATRTNLAFTFIMALSIGVAISLADAVTNRSWAKLGKTAAIAIPSAIGAALVAGLIANFVYTTGIESLYQSANEKVFNGELSETQALDWITLRLHPLRGGAWMLVGIAAGIAAGAASRSWKRLGLAVLGGAIGGFLGGFIFDFIPMGETEAEATRNEMVAQFIGMVLLGVLIGLAVALVEQASKSRWVEIVAGGLAGKQFILYKSSITMGSSPSADITLIKDPTIAPVAAMLRMGGQSAQIDAMDHMTPVFVNGTAQMSGRIVDGDIVTIGTTQLRFREKASQGKVPGALRN